MTDCMSQTIRTGAAIRVTSYGHGARLIDCGRTGEVTGFGRTRVVVRLGYGNGMPAEVRRIDPKCLRVTA